MDMLEKLNWIIPVLLGAFCTYIVSLKLYKRRRFQNAATSFRNELLKELEGLYPIPPFWQTKDYPRFIQSIPKIVTAAAKFKPFVKRKAELDAAVKKYREYCQQVKSDSVSAWHMYPSMRNPKDLSPEEIFRETVEHLLSFAERK
jgi:hypothetical protein